MREQGTTDAVVLRLVDYKDSHRIVTLYSEQWGLTSAMARSARGSSKRFSGSLDIFHRGQALFGRARGNGTMASLKSFSIHSAYEKLRIDLVRFAIASFWSELVLSTTAEGDPSGQQYAILTGLLSQLDQSDTGHRLDLILAFQIRWFDAMGILPPLDDEGLTDAGLAIPSERALAVARGLNSGVAIPELTPELFQEIGAMTRTIRRRLTGKEFASTRFLMEMLTT